MRAGNQRFEPRRKAKNNARLTAGLNAKASFARSPNRLGVWALLFLALGLYAHLSGLMNVAYPLFLIAGAAIFTNVAVWLINRKPL